MGLCPRCLLTSLDAADEPEADAPRIFGDYEILHEIASGGMGTIFKARQRSLGRTVALKVITGGPLAAREVVERFRNEAQAAASLSHPHIVPIYEVGEIDGQLFFSMEFIDGPSLDRFLKGRPLAPAHAVRMLIKVARAVHFAHQRGILHRDLKPGNILVDGNEEPRLTDFGLAKVLEKDSAITQTRAWLGTPSYMSPEQAGGTARDVTIAADVYGLGAVLFELLTGQPPFAGGTTIKTIRQVVEMEPRNPSTLNREVDFDLATICLKCLEKEPAARYESALSVAEELERWTRREPILARPVGPLERAKKWSRRHPKYAALMFAFVGAVALGIAATIHQWLRAEEKSAIAGRAQLHAERLVTRLDLERAEDYFVARQRPEAVALLAGVLRTDPSNRVAAERLFSFLSHHTFALPISQGFGDGAMTRAMMPSPDGKWLALGGSDGAVQVWSTDFPRLEWSVANDSEVTNLGWSQDGRFLVSGFFNKKIRIWDATAHQQIGADLQHFAAPNPVFPGNSERLIIWSWLSPKIVVMNWRSGEVLREIDIGKPVRGVRAVPGADQFLAATANLMQLWDLDGNRLQTLEGFDYPNVGASTPGGRFVAASVGTKKIVLCDGATLKPLPFQFEEDMPEGRPTFSSDGLWLVMGEVRRVGELRDLRSGRAINIPLLHGDSGRLAWLLGDGRRLLTSGIDDCAARINDAAPGAVLTPPLRHQASITAATFDPAGKRILTASSDRTARIWDPFSATPLTAPAQHPAPLSDAFFSSDGNRFATIARDNAIRIWAASDAKLLATLPHSKTIHAATFSPDGNQVAVATDDNAFLWDLTQTPPSAKTLSHKTRVRFLSYDPRGNYVATGASPSEQELLNTANYLLIWPTGQTAPSATIEIPSRLGALAVSPSGKLIAVAMQGGSVAIWDVEKSGWRLRENFHHETVSSLRFSADDAWLLSAGRDKVCLVINTSTGEQRHGPLHHIESVAHAEFSSNGNRILTLTSSGIPRLWDVETGMPLTELFDGLPGSAAAVPPSQQGRLLSADGEMLLAVSRDFSVRSLRAPVPPLPAPAWLPELAENIVGRRLASSRSVEERTWNDYLETRERLKSIPGNDFYSQWARWFFANRGTRTIAPWARQTVPEYTRARLEENTADSLFEAIRLEPTNVVVMERLGKILNTGKVSGLFNTTNAGESLLQRARALQSPEAMTLNEASSSQK